ncbi:MAG: MmcQ/YjbR family DNA-binding protein [Candidatus Acidiferrales bacterium]
MRGRRIASKPPTKKKTVKAKASADARVTFDTVRQISLSLDHAEEGTSYGTAAFKVHGALFVRLHQDLESTIVVRTDFEQREELLAADPETYYITDHYRNYEWVLVRLTRVQPEALRDLLRMAHRLAAASKRGSSRRQ